MLSCSQQGQIKGVVVRLSNAFGAPTHKNANCWMLLTNDLCMQAAKNRKLVLKTNGLHHRDFIALSDICHVIEQLAVGHNETMQTCIYNVGAGVSMSIFEMAQLIKQRCTQVLGFDPVVERVEGGTYEKHPVLNYRACNLTARGINCSGLNSAAEIDHLLSFANSTFNNAQRPMEHLNAPRKSES